MQERKPRQYQNSFLGWCSTTALVLNVKECNVVSFSRKHNIIRFDYFTIFSRPDSIRVLGIVFDRKITFDLHMKYIISRSMSMLGLLKRFGRKFSDHMF
jgi:hypothetical protein